MKREMIQEEYVKFETAKLLKDAGFPQDIKQTMFYNKFGQDWHMGDHHWTNGFAKPSQAQAMRWLREHHINIRINWQPKRHKWFFDMLNIDYIYDYFESEDYLPTYEAAAEAGIQTACKYLIDK